MTAASHGPVANDTTRTNIQKAALVTGAVFLLVGVLGFIPGVTTNYGQMGFAGPDSEALLLGLFQVSILHNIVHMLFGVAGVLMARSASAARNYMIGGGAVYLVLWIYGLVIGHETAANFVPFNHADNWLHLFLAVGMIGVGLLLARRTTPRRR